MDHWAVTLITNLVAVAGAVLAVVRLLQRRISWNQLALWSAGSCVAGAVLWHVGYRLFVDAGVIDAGGSSLGGRGLEPGALGGALWALLNLGPLVLLAGIANRRLLRVNRYPDFSFLVCWGGMLVGAVLFYGLDIRSSLERIVSGYHPTEALVALTWSTLVSGMGLLAFDLSNAVFRVRFLSSYTLSWLIRTTVVVVATTSSANIVMFLLPRDSAAETAVRGTVASTVLIISVFCVTVATSVSEVWTRSSRD